MIKRLGIFIAFLAIFMFALVVISALKYDCDIRSVGSCNVAPWNNIVFKISATTNAHAEIYSLTNYSYAFCCNWTGTRTCTSGPVNNTIVKLSSTGNAHGSVKRFTYTTNICYQDIECENMAACTGDYPIQAFSLSAPNNSHFAIYSDPNYPIKICCKNPNEPPETLTCAQQGGTQCSAPNYCVGSTPPASDTSNCCVGCCANPDSTTCGSRVCGTATNNCGTQVNCPPGGDGSTTKSCWQMFGTCNATGTQTCTAQGQWGSCSVTDPGIAYCQSTGRECGDNTCGGSCGTCTLPETCNAATGMCEGGCVVNETQSQTCTRVFGAGYQCGTTTDNCGGTVNCGSCNATSSCVSGQCIQGAQPCNLISAAWDRANAVEGTTVHLDVQGSSSTSCNGLTISFEVKEDDGILGSDPVNINPSNIQFTGANAQGNWIAEYQSDQSGDPEYFFRANITSTGEILQSGAPNPLLTVTQTPQSCQGITLCTHYTDQASCEADACATDANEPANTCAACALGDESHDINCRCYWDASGTGECKFTKDTETCPNPQQGECNNNNVQEDLLGESCDGTDLAGKTCADFNFAGGDLACDNNCSFDPSGCTGFYCDNDGIVDFGNETCDGTNFTREEGGVYQCTDPIFDDFDRGDLVCNNCIIDPDGCIKDNFGGGGEEGFLIGNCTYTTNTIKECDEEPVGIYTASWDGTWRWGVNNTGWSSTNDCIANSPCDLASECVLDGILYYCDPEGKSGLCTQGGSTTIECPAQIRLPFFNAYGLIVSLLAIFAVYFLISRRHKKVL
jgi:hypothetical protein